MRERDYYFDNLKAVLIFLVVFGHMILPIEGVEWIIGVKRFIYTFHMPLFIFVTGYFGTYMWKNGKLRVEKIFSYFFLYIGFVLVLQLLGVLSGTRVLEQVHFWKQSAAPWYLFATLAWFLMIPLAEKLQAKKTLILSLLISLAVGYLSWVGDVFVLSRILVFAPFFWLGYFATKDQIMKRLERKYAYVIVPIAIVIGIYIVGFQWQMPRIFRMIYGNVSYLTLKENYLWGPVVRLALMVIAAILSWAVMLIVPRRKMWFSVAGARTLQIYVIHKCLRNILQYTPYYETTNFANGVQVVLLLVISVVMTYALAERHIKIVFDAFMEYFTDTYLGIVAAIKGRRKQIQ